MEEEEIVSNRLFHTTKNTGIAFRRSRCCAPRGVIGVFLQKLESSSRSFSFSSPEAAVAPLGEPWQLPG